MGSAPGLSPNQVGAVISRLAYLDRLLATVDDLARGTGSVFRRERQDLTPDEAAMVQAFASRARAALVAALDVLGIDRPVPDGSARWSALTALTFADIAAGELTGSALRGYGELDPAAAQAVESVARQLRAMIHDGRMLLREYEPGGLADRLARLPGPAGAVLGIVDRVSTAHRLVAVRPLVAAAADRAGDTLFAVGVFGRVSSGKSSLINALLAREVLPVGTTPVTAVPVAVERGAESVEVDLAAGSRSTVALAALPEYATEEGNPGNARGVRSVHVHVPDAPAGVRLLDTPGVGSLAGGGPARAFAWLPRCDLGLVLVAAGTPVGRDELALVSGLMNAGITCRILLSKADTLSDADRDAAVRYVAADLGRALGSGAVPEVTAVSVRPGERATLEALRRDVLEPRAADHVVGARLALVRRLRALVAETARAVRARTPGEAREEAGSRGGPVQPSDTAAVETALRSIRRTAAELADSGPAIIAEAASQVAIAWARGENGRDAARAAIVRAAGSAVASVRDALAQPLSGVARLAADAGAGRVPPLFDPELLDTLPALDPPALAPGPLRRRAAAHRLAAVQPQLSAALGRFAARLAAWGEAGVERRAEGTGPPDGEPGEGPVEELPELAEAMRLIDAMERAPAA